MRIGLPGRLATRIVQASEPAPDPEGIEKDRFSVWCVLRTEMASGCGAHGVHLSLRSDSYLRT